MELQKGAVEQQRLAAELQKGTVEKQRIAAEKDQIASEKQRIASEKDKLAGEKDRIASEKNRISTEKDQIAAEKDKVAAEKDRLAAEAAKLREEGDKERERLLQLKSEADALVKKRADEAAKLAEVQAQQRRLVEGKAARLEEARLLAEKKAQASEALRQAEERRMRAQADEAQRLAEEAQASRRLQATEAASKAAEERAQRAAAEAKSELVKVEQLRADARKLWDQAQAAKLEVNRHRAETERLAAMQQAERAQLEKERQEARRLADKRTLEAERAAHAAALASRSTIKMEAAEREARRVADERAKESARLEAAQHEAARMAEERAAEWKRLETARAEARTVALKREAELQQLTVERLKEEARLQAAKLELQKQAADRLRLEAERARMERERGTLAAQKGQLEAEHGKLSAEKNALEQKVAQARIELARLESEARERLAVVPTPAKVAAPQKMAQPATVRVVAVETPRVTGEKLRASLPVTKVAAPKVTVKVRDVRFSDDSDAARVIVEVGGDAEYTVLRADPRTAVLRIAGADLPSKLERTLDVAAYKGPVRSISTYADPDDPGAVRVVANLASGGDGETQAEPKITREGGQISMEFAKVQTRSYPPQRVGAFGASIPLQTAAAMPTQLPTAGGRRRHVYTGRRISLDFKDIDIHNVLRLLADVGQVNIVTSDDVKGSVTIRMVDVPWDQALDVILKAKGLGLQREGNLIRVAQASALEKELEAEIARAKAAVELKPIDTRLIPLSYAEADKMAARVADLMSPRGKVSIDQRTNMLIVSDVASNIALAEDLVRNLDTQTPQVLIESRIVEARSTFLRDIGIQWGGNSLNSPATGNPTGIAFPSTVGVAGGATDATASTAGLQGGAAASPNYVVNMPAAVGTGSGGALGLTLGSVNGAVNINLRLSSLENTGNVRIISAPKITTLDNVEASIEQGVAIPISVVSAAGTNTVFVDAKLNLTVKPHVTNEGSVIMNVQITRNEPDFVNVGARGDPTILKKQAKTEMLVRDGDTAVIGGIYTRNTGLSYTKVPWFADIPVIGWLFKNRRENDDRTELLIFITPRIVNRAVVKR